MIQSYFKRIIIWGKDEISIMRDLATYEWDTMKGYDENITSITTKSGCTIVFNRINSQVFIYKSHYYKDGYT